MTSGWRALADDWLGLANQDLALARLAFRETSISDDAFAFHVQQAIEKSLKAVIATGSNLPPATHDLARLIERSGREHPFDVDELDELSPYASAVLQPGLPPPPRHLDREHALARAFEVRLWAEDLVERTE
ncbi:MAG: HEPN domain-containing protein [Candidatus Dormibacteraceae bacterium]